MSESERKTLSWAETALAVSEAHGLEGCVVVGKNPNGTFGLSVHGLNHGASVEALALGIHLVLADHDRAVLAGEAGPEAKALAEFLNVSNHSERTN